MAYLIYLLAAVVGFVALFFGATLLIGEVAGTMPYEDGLPILLVAGAAGGTLGVLIARRVLRSKAHTGRRSSTRP